MEIVFSTTNKWFSRGIRYFTKKSWVKSARCSHTSIRYGEAESNWMVQSNLLGFLPDWWPKFSTNSKIIKKFKIIGIDENELERIVDEEVNKYAHTEYDFWSIPRFLIAIFYYKLTGKRLKNFLIRSSGLGCSEVVYRIFLKIEEVIKQKIFDDFDPETVFPEELLIQCENKPQFFKDTTDGSVDVVGKTNENVLI